MLLLVLAVLGSAQLSHSDPLVRRARREALVQSKRVLAPNGEQVYMTATTTAVQPASSVTCPGVDYCTVSGTLYGTNLASVGLVTLTMNSSVPTPPTAFRPVNGIALNPFYPTNGFPYDNGCTTGVTIWNPPRACCELEIQAGSWNSTRYDAFFGQAFSNASCPGAECFRLGSIQAPPMGNITIPIAQLSYTGLTGQSHVVHFDFQDATGASLLGYDTCCGCGCTTVTNVPPPLRCDIPVDLNTQINENNAATLNQEGFISFPFNASSPFGTVLDDMRSGYRFEIVGGSFGFNNIFQNTFPPTPNALLIDGLGDNADPDFVGVAIYQLQRGTYNVKVWIFDQDNLDLSNHSAFWAPYVIGNPSDNPDLQVFGPFQPQPTPYNASFSYGSNPGPFAGSFSVVADGTQAYQLLVRAEGCVNASINCRTRLNGFQLTLVDVTEPVLTCQDSTVFATGCYGNLTWCNPVSVSDNCPLPDPGLNDIYQVGGPAELSTQYIGAYPIRYAAEDTAGNIGYCNFTVFVVSQNPPVISACPADINLTTTPDQCCVVGTWQNPSFGTDCDQALNVVYTPANGTCFPPGNTTVRLVVTDVVGRNASCEFVVRVVDASPPQLCVPPQDVTLPCGGAYKNWLDNAGYARFVDGCSVPVVPSDPAAFCGAFPVRACSNFTTNDPAILAGQQTFGPACFSTADASCQCDGYLLNYTLTNNGTDNVNRTQDVGVEIYTLSAALGRESYPPFTVKYKIFNATTPYTQVISPVANFTLEDVPFGQYAFILTDAIGRIATACVAIPISTFVEGK